MADSKVNLISWNRFITRNFVVIPEILGLTHEFSFENALVRIELPAADNLPKDITDEFIRNSHDSIITIVSHKKENGHKKPTAISVNSVDVSVNLNKIVNLPEEVSTRNPNPYDLLSDKQQKQLDNLAMAHGDIADKAFDLWIRVLRWKSGNGAIARPEIHGIKSGWSTYLLNDMTKRRFWAAPHTFTFRIYKPVTLSEWNEVEETLNLGQNSPVYIDSMFDGIEQFNLGNFERSIIDLAVACETFMRIKVSHNLPGGLTSAVLKYIDEANIRQVQEHLFKDTLSEKQKEILKSTNSNLHKLFDARNAIMHSGHKEDLTSDECKKYIEATKKLITFE